MRSDFNKLLCERERHKSKYDSDEKNEIRSVSRGRILKDYPENFELDDHSLVDSHPYEDCPSNDRMHGNKFRSKYLNENLSPLVNFLRKRVGKNWNKVYSEICQNFKKTKAINFHIFQHLFQFVETKTRVGPSGKPQFFFSGFNASILSRQSGWVYVHEYTRFVRVSFLVDQFFVHPKTGALTPFINFTKPKGKHYDWEWFDHPTDKKRKFYKNNGVWYMVIFERFNRDDTVTVDENGKLHYAHIECLFCKVKYHLGKTTHFAIYNYWGEYIYAIGKFQLSKKQIKEFKLNELKAQQDMRARENPRRST